MADVKQTVDFVIRQEDQKLEGKITNTASDRGGLTRWGLTQRWHPELVESGFFTTMDRDDSFALAETTYEKVYSGPLFLSKLYNQVAATALLSFSVLEGNLEAITLFQKALVSLGAKIAVDGIMGSETVSWANAAKAGPLVSTLIALQKAYFATIARNAPSQAKFVAGWGNRADAILALLTVPSPAATLPAVAAVAPTAPVDIPDAQESPTGA